MAFEPARNAYRHPHAAPHHQADSAPADEHASGGAQEAAAPDPAEDAAIAGAPTGKERTAGATTAARWPARLAAGVADIGRRLKEPVPAGIARAIAAAATVPPAAAAAGAIGVAALVLALLAGEGDGEFPGPAFEAGLLSSASPRQAAEGSEASEASEAPGPVASMASDALAERLVETPAFDLRRDAEAAAGATAEAASVGAPAGWNAAEPPPSSPDEARDPVAVLAAAVPPPADPALRVLEQLRAHDNAPAANGAPLAAAAGPEAGAGVAIQLLAAGRRELAAEAWSRLQRDNADLLGHLQPTIVEPEPTVSTLFRLRAGPLATVREAQALCAALVRRKVDCIVLGGG